ncbi:MAG: hypothetical protein K9M57_01625 [Phycisphaerae bacterium]|nr:hypothetical protein [Phycisphaerae bacterium]
MTHNRGRRWAKRLAILLIVLILLAFGLLLTGYLLVKHRPNEYKPFHLNKLQQDDVEAVCTKRYVQDFHNNVVLKKPFSITYDQDLLNGVLMFDDQTLKRFLWPGSHESYNQFTQQFYQPQLSFKEGAVYIMGQVAHEGVSAILTIGFKPQIVDGHRLKVTLLPIKLGAARLPGPVMDEVRQGVIDRMAGRIKKYNQLKEKDLEGHLSKNIVRAIPELLDQNVFIVDSLFHVDNDVQAEITAIAIKNGHMRIDFLPSMREDR